LDPLTFIAFILILSLLVFVHELGHFIVAKRAGITVEEFAIGFPPRAVKLYQEGGAITLDGHEFDIDRKLQVPRTIQPGAQVYAETAFKEDGRPVVTKLELIKAAESEQPEKEPKPGFDLSRFFGRKTTPKAPETRPTVVVDAITRPTEYAINWIPFGGYVRMLGEEDPSAPGSFASKSKRARFAVLVAGSSMNLLLAVVFFTLTAMSGVPQSAVGTVVTDVVPGAPAAQAGLRAGDMIVGADDTEFKYDGDLVNYVNENKGTEITLHLNRDGDMVNATLVPRVNPPEGEGSMGVMIQYLPVARVVVTQVLPDTPAAAAGIQPDDVIAGAGDTAFTYTGDLASYLAENPEQEITLVLERKGEIVTVSLTPNPLPTTPTDPAGEGLGVANENQAALGVQIEYDFETKLNHMPLPQAMWSGVTQTVQFVGLTFYMPIAILRNLIPAEAARVTGPVGIYQQTASAVDAAVTLNWWFPVLWLTAVLSTALAVTNLLPLPALDGGRILFVLIEAIRGKRVSPEKEGAIHFIGLALLVTLMLVISYYDISNPLPTIDWGSFF
jgi:regulator of sigma E protease